MRGTSQTIEVRDYVLEGNVIKWEYKGKDQRGPSTFTFTLIENEGKDDMFTVDKCDVLRLVSCSCQADDDDGRFDMFIDTDIVLPSNGVDGKTPVLESGETQTLEPGSEATSEIVPDGEDEAGNPRYKVNLGIPAGEPFTYDDFTPEQIEGLKKPALDAAAVAEAAADAATKAAANADNAAKTATEAASSANDAADRAGQAAVDAGLAKTAAEEAAERATEAAGAAGSAAEEANAAAESASQTNTEVSTAEQGRVTAEEQRAAAEQTRQTEFSQLKQEAQTATQEANAAAQAANQAVESIEESLSVKQDKTDESLQTTDKTVTGAINEVNQVVKTKQDKLKAGTGVEITFDNTVNVTLDTTVFKVVASLPESPAAGDENKIHLVPAESTEEGNIYTEYVFVNGKWEEFGTYRSEVDLTPYLKKEDAEATYQKITDNTLATTAKTVVGAINEVNTGLKSAVKPYVVDLTSLLAAQDSESISTAIGGIDNLNGTVQKNQVIFGTQANGTVAVGIRVLGNQTTLTYFVDSVVGLTVNEVIITNTSGALTKTANTHAVITENMVVNSLESDETTLPLSAAQGKVLNKSIGQPVIEDIDLTTEIETGYYWHVDGTKGAAVNYSIKYVNLSKGDLLIINVMSSSSVAQLTVVDSTHTKVVQAIDSKGEGNVNVKSSFLADRDCIVAISYYSNTAIPNTYAYIVKSSQNTAIADITTSTAALHKVYESYGAVYNKDTGYWEYGDLKDLTEEECMYAAMFAFRSVYSADNNTMKITNIPSNTLSARTIFTGATNYYSWSTTTMDLKEFCHDRSIEYIRLLASVAEKLVPASLRQAFRNCGRLVTIEDVIVLSKTDTVVDDAFYNCQALKNVKIAMKSNIVGLSFESSSRLSYESLNYLVTNAANTSAITVIVHPTTYSYLTGTAQPTAEVGGTTEEWQALVTSAQGKQISFAVPEETQSEVTE